MSAGQYGWVSLLLGVIALGMAIVPLLTNSSTSVSYVLCSVGVSAVLLGMQAVRSGRSVAAGHLGVLTGGIATVLMIAQAAWFHSLVGSQGTLLPLGVNAPAAVDPTPAIDASGLDVTGFVASTQDLIRDVLLSPARMIAGFALLTLILCVGSVTILRWIGRTVRKTLSRRRQSRRGSASSYRPSWERIDGTRSY